MNVVIYNGHWTTFQYGQKVPGLDLGRFVRDTLRENGYPTLNDCDGCTQPNLCDLLTDCDLGGSNDWEDLINVPQAIQDIEGLTPANGDMLYFDGANWVLLEAGVNGQYLSMTGGIPTWAAAAGGTDDWNNFTNVPQAIQDIEAVVGVTGDILYYDGANWVKLGIGSAGQALTVVGGLPAWAAGGTSYLGLTDTPANFTAGEDIVPTINALGTALVHESNNILHTGSGEIGADATASGDAVDSFTSSSGDVTVIGNKAFLDFDGTVTLDGVGAGLDVDLRVNFNNLSMKYSMSGVIIVVKVLVNGTPVDTTINGGDADDTIFRFTVGSNTDTIAFHGFVIGNV